MTNRKLKITIMSMVLVATLSIGEVITVNAKVLPKRLAGANRYITACKIADEGWQQSDYVILAYGENYPDALCATPLAKKNNCPILLTTKDILQEDTKTELVKLKVKNVIIVGGTGVISSNIQNQLDDMDIKVQRLAGQDRYETCIKIAEQLGNVEELFAVSGLDYFDALSVSVLSATINAPIILNPQGDISETVKNYIKDKKIKKTYAITNEMYKFNSWQYPNSEIFRNEDKYQKSSYIFKAGENRIFNLNKIYFATGENYPDALCASALAAKTNSPLILVDKKINEDIINTLNSKSSLIKDIFILGGESIINNNIIDSCNLEEIPKLELNKEYITDSGMSVRITNADLVDKNGYKEYVIYYTLKNNSEKQLTEGAFSLLLENNTSATQWGFFGDLMPTETLNKKLSFKILKDDIPIELQYKEMNFNTMNSKILRMKIQK